MSQQYSKEQFVQQSLFRAGVVRFQNRLSPGGEHSGQS